MCKRTTVVFAVFHIRMRPVFRDGDQQIRRIIIVVLESLRVSIISAILFMSDALASTSMRISPWG